MCIRDRAGPGRLGSTRHTGSHLPGTHTGGAVPVDENRLIRIDDLELDPEVQDYVSERMPLVTEENLSEIGDLEGYKHDFLATNGFDVEGVDYNAEIERMDII